MCDEIIKSYDKKTKTIAAKFIEKKKICKMQNFYFLLAFLLKAHRMIFRKVLLMR